MTERYWFAPLRQIEPQSPMVMPVAWQGVVAVVGFLIGFGIAIAGFFIFTRAHIYFLALAWPVVWISGSGAGLIWATVQKRDPQRTFADYRAGRPASN